MASSILHIKDSYYFEVPKFLWQSRHSDIDDFPTFWIRLDEQYQVWEGERLYDAVAETADERSVAMPSWEEVQHEWQHWQHADHANFAKPLDIYLESQASTIRSEFLEWQASDSANELKSLTDYIEAEHPHAGWFAKLAHPKAEDARERFQEQWEQAVAQADNVREFKREHSWSPEKIESYNKHLSGKILIPQHMGELRNLYQAESGVCISKFMVIQTVVAILIAFTFIWLAGKIRGGGAPKGRLWNFFEVILLYFRDSVVRPAIHHEHDEPHEGEHAAHGEHAGGEAAADAHPEHENEYADADRFVPLLWTVFVFILGLNLAGMIPWVGSPTGSFSTNTALAMVVLATGIVCGVKQFGVAGYFTHFVPDLGEIPKKPKLMFIMMTGLFFLIRIGLMLIEILGLLIKHGVLAIRLLANMFAGHLVILAIMGLAFGATGVASLAAAPTWQWGIWATISILGATAFNCLELFVAFLQAYVFTFLSALFIATSIHKH